jgi:mono/diheme cytochrome c family protein
MLCRMPLLPRAAALACLALAACGSEPPQPARAAQPPLIAGLDAPGLPALVRGRVLLGELGCVACHDAAGCELELAPGPDLATVAARVAGGWLAEFLRSPHAVAPGTPMPDLVRGRADVARQLAAYLRSFAPAPARDGEIADAEATARGAAAFERIGCRLCHADDRARGAWSRKYSLASLRAFLLEPHRDRPGRRMPDFKLSPTEAHDLACFLAPANTDTQAEARPPADVDAGRAHFATLGCARCHALADGRRPPPPSAPPLAALDPARGCLSGAPGAWPHYALTEAQRADLRVALADDRPADNEARILQALASRRCLVCHARGAVNAVAGAHERFGSDDASLGDEGRLPPPLTGVGARLQRDWLRRAIAHGQRERPYLQVRMPGFGEAFAQRLAELLAATDTLPAVAVTPLPDERKAAEAVLEIGRELVGDGGMNCIACHRFAGEQAGAMGALDLVHTTGERLRPEWFAHFLRDPYRFKPGTLMPHFFPDGRSTRPEFADGDVGRQIGALWHYLAAGRNVRRPHGLHQPPIELVVGDEAVLLRRSAQGAGKRAIAVGYPGGVNLTFDAENLGMNQIWWGRFVDARPVWTAQGSGETGILEREVAQLGDGPALATLADADAPWPLATRRERGDRWLGYELDEQRRPTFCYTCGDVRVDDKPQQAEGATLLHRTLRLTGPHGELWLRAAQHERIESVDAHTFRVGALLVRCADAPGRIVGRELRFALAAAPEGRAFTIEYRRENGR